MTRDEQPRSTVEQLIRRFLPRGSHRFLISQSEEVQLAHLILRGLFGALSGAVMFLAVAPGIPLNFDLKLATGCAFTGEEDDDAAVAPPAGCACDCCCGRVQGRVWWAGPCRRPSGPVSNIRRNVETAAASLSCNLDLQVRNAKLLWRDAVTPFLKVAQEVVEGEAEFEADARGANEAFAAIRDEVLGRHGYGQLQDNHESLDTNETRTQERFAYVTEMQCDRVVDQSVGRCAKWFDDKWKACLEAIPVPVINHILCVPMKFHFLCDIVRVMTGWCKQHIPVEKNFGQLFDRLNGSVDLLSREFASELVVKERQRQAALDGELVDGDFTRGIQTSFRQLEARTRQLLDILQLLVSFAFMSLFTQSLGYVRQFRGDIYFDNIYITKYFGIIDQRRRSQGKRSLLPLTPSERGKFVDPWSPRIHPEEVKQVVSSVFQVLSALLLAAVLLTVDVSVFRVLDVVSKHTRTVFNFTSSQQVAIEVGGDSMMARLLRRTLSAFNASSSVRIVSDNRRRVRGHALLAGRLGVRQRDLVPPAGGALQLPSGLRQPPTQSHCRLFPSAEGENQNLVLVQSQPAQKNVAQAHAHGTRTHKRAGVFVRTVSEATGGGGGGRASKCLVSADGKVPAY
ncbi:E3 ubiquitin-protein ligase DCST1 isoform X2 [Phyllopteryx taeniolatus]|uniref:E3 ubiquitin-protein ligase DCST1 isoform X2 n=1 Tax=Phyllopteryx taeniolatus TaxID=161469 RepID=UPI002AD404F4|nr:E3 ubiquitin-protein ligase DCST1 isoform X2 [Phyllopteryx taeniolatus]